MLVLLFHARDQKFGFAGVDVVEIVPCVRLSAVPGAPREVAGLMNYHGNIVPVLDVTTILAGKPGRLMQSSRIVIINVPAEGLRDGIAGLLAECVIATARIDDSDIRPTELKPGKVGGLGKVFLDDGEPVQLVRAEDIVPSSLVASLFEPAGAVE